LKDSKVEYYKLDSYTFEELAKEVVPKINSELRALINEPDDQDAQITCYRHYTVIVENYPNFADTNFTQIIDNNRIFASNQDKGIKDILPTQSVYYKSSNQDGFDPQTQKGVLVGTFAKGFTRPDL